MLTTTLENFVLENVSFKKKIKVILCTSAPVRIGASNTIMKRVQNSQKCALVGKIAWREKVSIVSSRQNGFFLIAEPKRCVGYNFSNCERDVVILYKKGYLW